LAAIPHLKSIDSTLAVWREGYEFIRRRSHRLQSDVFRGRLLGKPAVFMTGAAAAELFYDPSRFRREGAVPLLVQKTLFGRGGVQGLDDAEHTERKALFMGLMSRGALQHFIALADSRWMEESRRWESFGRVVLFDAARDVLCAAACDWAGVTLGKRRMKRLARDCVAMVDGFASLSPRTLRAYAARRRSERCAERQIRAIS
jgi:fatty-acid peroxygenase